MSQSGLISTNSGEAGIETINGDSGSITGSSVTIFSNQATLNSGASVSFNNTGTISTFNVTDSNLNTIIGKSSGVLAGSGGGNNVIIGSGSFVSVGVVTSQNVALGNSSLASFVGDNSVGNVALGHASLVNLLDGADNIAIGRSVGISYVGTESGNILIRNSGTVGDNNTIRIGSTHQSCFISGIYSSTTDLTTAVPCLVDSNGKLTSSSSIGIMVPVIFKSASVALTVQGDTVLFNCPMDFMITRITCYGDSVSSPVGAPIANFGWTGPAYDNFSSGFINFANDNGVYQGSLQGDVFTNSPFVPAGQDFRINVTSEDIVTPFNSQVFFIEGFYFRS